MVGGAEVVHNIIYTQGYVICSVLSTTQIRCILL